jgi:hypothetical protein
MKKLMMILAAAFLSSAAFAQGFGNFDQGEMVKNRTEEQVKQYKLNEDQAKQLEALNTKYAEKMGFGFMMMGGGRGMGRGMGGGQRPQGGPQGGFGGGQGGFGGGQGGFGGGQMPQMSEEQRAQMQERMKQMQENMEAYDKELEQIFTPEQFKAYKEDQEKNRARRGGPRPQ